jgi:hypothetical protein
MAGRQARAGRRRSPGALVFALDVTTLREAPGEAGPFFSRRDERIMNQRSTYSRHLEMGFGRRGGLWAGIVAVLSAIVVIVLAVLFSALFLGLFVAIGVGVMLRSWLLGRSASRPRPDVIEAEYTVVDQRDPQQRRGQ